MAAINDWHFFIGKDRHDNNINLCGQKGAATNNIEAVTCEKCRAKAPPPHESDMGIIVTPHLDTSYSCCVFLERVNTCWQNDALDYACEVMESLWGDLEPGNKISVTMELRKLTPEEIEAAR